MGLSSELMFERARTPEPQREIETDQHPVAAFCETLLLPGAVERLFACLGLLTKISVSSGVHVSASIQMNQNRWSVWKRRPVRFNVVIKNLTHNSRPKKPARKQRPVSHTMSIKSVQFNRFTGPMICSINRRT